MKKMRITTVVVFSGLAVSLATSSCAPILDVRGEETICPVHDEPLQEDVVRIVYGYLLYKEGYGVARSQEFPYANSFFEGGCVIQPEQWAKVLFCPMCREVEDAWHKTHSWDQADPAE